MSDKNLKFFRNCLNENNFSHAFLVETNNYDGFVNQIFNLFLEYGIISNQASISNNISVRVVLPENNNIDKEAIYDLQNFVSTTSFDGKYKIYFILGANLMSVSAANKLLKTLEEPPTKSIGFLICDDASLILSTLKSRCQLITNNDDEVVLDNYDKEIFNEICNFINFNYEEFVKFKKNLLKQEKVLVLNLFYAYGEYLHSNNSIFYIKIIDFIDRIKHNCNLELQLDKLFLERNK